MAAAGANLFNHPMQLEFISILSSDGKELFNINSSTNLRQFLLALCKMTDTAYPLGFSSCCGCMSMGW